MEARKFLLIRSTHCTLGILIRLKRVIVTQSLENKEAENVHKYSGIRLYLVCLCRLRPRRRSLRWNKLPAVMAVNG